MNRSELMLIYSALNLLMVCWVLADVTFGGRMIVELTDALNKRMALMRDVAGYKSEHHKPVEDLDREAKVLNQTKNEAKNSSLDPSSVTTFIQAQMDVGKAIQYRFLADWLSQAESRWPPPHDLENVRNNITNLDRTILRLISEQIREKDGFGEEQKAELKERLNAPNIKAADKNHLVNSLNDIKILAPKGRVISGQRSFDSV